ncbi:polysaccharide biosynthesis/export family protein, partial [Mycobacterium tuberculosis]
RLGAGLLAVTAASLWLTACATTSLPAKASNPLDLNTLNTRQAPQDYVIGPLDKINIRVFEVKDLSQDVQVDASGSITIPLVGSMVAEGKTVGQLSHDIATRLGERYLQSPQVSVSVVESASQKIIVEGEAKSPGVFPMHGRTTLVQAIAMAGGVSTTANIHRVAVIRDINGTRKAAICDYAQIRSGAAPDPVLQGDDIVVVDGSQSKSFFEGMLKALPIFALFATVF